MTRSLRLGVFGLVVVTTLSAGRVTAGARTYVAFAGRDDAVPKLGLPGIAVHVQAPSTGDVASVTEELARELTRQVHTRRLAADEPGNYDPEITVDAPKEDGATTTVRFVAILKSVQGERLWRVEGRSDVEDAPRDAAFFAGISRNVISALIHDGWVQPRYDPDNPPPPPPNVRSE